MASKFRMQVAARVGLSVMAIEWKGVLDGRRTLRIHPVFPCFYFENVEPRSNALVHVLKEDPLRWGFSLDQHGLFIGWGKKFSWTLDLFSNRLVRLETKLRNGGWHTQKVKGPIYDPPGAERTVLPFRHICRWSGRVTEAKATVYKVQRRYIRPTLLRWCPLFEWRRDAIDVYFEPPLPTPRRQTMWATLMCRRDETPNQRIKRLQIEGFK
jgi:hypothetical protein